MSRDSRPTFLLRLKNQNRNAKPAIRPIEPNTPPTTGAAVSGGFEETPPSAEDSAVDNAAVGSVVEDIDIARELKFPFPPVCTEIEGVEVVEI